MVLCRKINLAAGCEDALNGGKAPFKCPVPSTHCETIVGNDHLKKKRAHKFRCRSKRITSLARPKYFSQKYLEEKTCNGKAAVEVIRTYEEQTPVRIKLLAYPKVRKLVSSREAYRNIVDKQWYERFEELINRSMLTMYSRMADVQLPNRSQRKKWTRADWQRHCEWLKKRAMPKMQPAQPEKKRKKVPLQDLMNSMETLSKPRHKNTKFRTSCGFKSSVKIGTLNYKPTERILKLAEPKHSKSDEDLELEFDPFQVNPRALVTVASKFVLNQIVTCCFNFFYFIASRIKALAIAKPTPQVVDDSDMTPFGVLKRALKAKLNQRTLDLSKPKEKADDEDEEEKPLVSPKALKAKPTPRIIQLAQPRLPIAEKITN